MGRGAQATTRQLTDQERANIDALNQQFLGQQQQVGNILLPQFQSILNNPGLSPEDKAAVTGQSQGALASAFDALQQSAQNRLARTRSRSAGMPRVRPRRFVSMPNRPESPCSAAIWR